MINTVDGFIVNLTLEAGRALRRDKLEAAEAVKGDPTEALDLEEDEQESEPEEEEVKVLLALPEPDITESYELYDHKGNLVKYLKTSNVKLNTRR